MKKLSLFIIACSIGMLMVSCGSDNTPGKVVENAFNEMVKKNYESFFDATTMPENMREFNMLILETTMNPSNENARKAMPQEINIVKEEAQDTVASVEVEVTNVGGELNKLTAELVKVEDSWKIKNPEIFMLPASLPASGEGLDLSGLMSDDDEASSEPNPIDEAEEKAK